MCVAVIVGVGVVVVEMQWRRVRCDTVASCSSRRELGACNEDRFFSDSVHPSLFMLAETLLRCQPLPARKQKEVLPIYPAASIFVRGGRPQRRSGERLLPLAAGGGGWLSNGLRGNCAGNPVPNSALQGSSSSDTSLVENKCFPRQTWRSRSLCCTYRTCM